MSNDNVMHDAPNTGGANSFLTKWSGVIIWGFFTVLLLVFVSLVVLAMQEEPQAAEVGFDRQNASVLAALSPQVAIKTPQDGDFRPIDETLPVTTGTEIRTNPGGQAVLFSGDGTRTVLDENTTVKLNSVDNENEQSRLALVAGSLWAQVDNALTGDESYEVQSANVVTSVRGTEFNITKEDDGGLSITTLQDEVTVGPARGEEPTSTIAVLSGEKAEIPTASSSNIAGLGTNSLNADQIREIILDNAQTEEKISNPELQEAQAIMDGIPTLAESEDQQESSSLERLGEAVHSSFFTDTETGQVRNNVLRAQERLQEARANADNPSKLEGIITKNYRQLTRNLAEQATQSDNPAVKRLVVDTTRQHQSFLTDLMSETSDPARRIVRNARMTAKDSHRQVLDEMASSSPRIAYQEGVRSMKTRLRSVLRDAAFNNNLDIRDSIGGYDRLMQINAKASNVSGSSTQANFADGLRKNLSVVNTVEKFESSLAPGIRRAVDESEDRIADTQLAAIASIATSSPEQAVEIYEKTADQYIEKINEAKSPEEAEESAAVYNKYASFAERVSQSASDESDGTSTVQEQFKEAADKQLEKLTQAQERAPESAQNAIREAIERQRQARNPGELPSPAERQGPPADAGPDQDGLPDQAEGQGPGVDPSERGNQGEGPDIDPSEQGNQGPPADVGVDEDGLPDEAQDQGPDIDSSEQGPPADVGSGEDGLPDDAEGQGPDLDPSERGNQGEGPDIDPSEQGNQGQGPDLDPSEDGNQGPIENPSENANQGPGENNLSDQNDLDDYLNEVKERSPKGEMQSLQNQNADNSQQQGNNGSDASDANPSQSNQQSENSQQSPNNTGQSDSGNVPNQQQEGNENDSVGSNQDQSNQQPENLQESANDAVQSNSGESSGQQQEGADNSNSPSNSGTSDGTQSNQGSMDEESETSPADNTTDQSSSESDDSSVADQPQQNQQSDNSTGQNTLDEGLDQTPVNDNAGNNNSPNNDDDTEQPASVLWWLNPF